MFNIAPHREVVSPPRQTTFLLTAGSVRESGENRHEKSSLTVTVRDNPSGKNVTDSQVRKTVMNSSLTAATVRKGLQRRNV
jgi:hypothetical protein